MKVKKLFVLAFLIFLAAFHGSCQDKDYRTYRDKDGFVFSDFHFSGSVFYYTSAYPSDSKLLPKNIDGKTDSEYFIEYDFLSGRKQFADTVKKYLPEKAAMIKEMKIRVAYGFAINSKEIVECYLVWGYSAPLDLFNEKELQLIMSIIKQQKIRILSLKEKGETERGQVFSIAVPTELW